VVCRVKQLPLLGRPASTQLPWAVGIKAEAQNAAFCPHTMACGIHWNTGALSAISGWRRWPQGVSKWWYGLWLAVNQYFWQ